MCRTLLSSRIEDFKKAFTGLLLGAQHERSSVEKKLASLLEEALGKALNSIPLSLCGKQVLKILKQEFSTLTLSFTPWQISKVKFTPPNFVYIFASTNAYCSK